MTNETPSNDDFDFDEPLRSAWAEQPERATPADATDTAAVIEGLEVAHRKDQRRLFWLNAREVLPSFVAAVFFASRISIAESPTSVIAGALILAAVGLFLAITSWRQYKADRSWEGSVRDQLARRLAQLNHRAWLFRIVAWWYFLPFGLAILLIGHGFGQDFGSADGLVFLGAILVVGVIAYIANRRNARVRYDLEIERLKPLLADFDIGTAG